MRGGQLTRIAESSEIRQSVVCIAIADIDKDGKYEVIAVVKGLPRMLIFRYDGSLKLWKSETLKHQVCHVAAGDTDGDGCPEVVVKPMDHKVVLYMYFPIKTERKLRSGVVT